MCAATSAATRSTLTQALIFAGGEAPDARARARLPDGALVIAADSGLEHALGLGLAVHLVVGDLDSVDPARLEAAAAAGARVERHPVAKDKTDLELALDAALARGASRALVVGAGGGPRLDHLLANALLLASPAYADLEVTALLGPALATVVRRRVTLHGTPGDLLTLLALGGPARGVRTKGLRFALHDEDLLPGSTRGVSNEFLRPAATVSVREGALMAVQPDGGVG